jgi:F-type H+-transporting ATPase subunit b
MGVDLGLLVSQIVNFGLLLLILYLALYKPVTRKLEERAQRIQKGLADAEASKALLADAEARGKEQVEQARREAREIIEQATLSAEQQRQEILTQARQEAHDLILRAQQQAQRELEQGRVALQQEIIDLAIASASRVLEEELDGPKQRQLVEQFITQVQQAE